MVVKLVEMTEGPALDHEALGRNRAIAFEQLPPPRSEWFGKGPTIHFKWQVHQLISAL